MIEASLINKFKLSKFLSVDIETKDPLLEDEGPGTHRGDGHICGVSMSTKLDSGKKFSHYFSFSHPDTSPVLTHENKRIVKDIVSQPMPKLGTNIAYDAEWLEHVGMPMNGELNDIQYAEPLLNEYRRSYHLDALAKVYTLQTKKTNVLAEYADVMGWKGKPIKHIWKMPEKVAAEYALTDSDLPLDIFERQKRNLETQNLWDLYKLEIGLLPVILRMRRNGVRIDTRLLRKASMEVADVHFKLGEEIFKFFGTEFNINSATQIAKLFDKKNIPYPRHTPTPKMIASGKTIGNPNLGKDVLNRLGERYPICEKILTYRHYTTLKNNFLGKYAGMLVGDRLYGQFHPLRNDDYGTVSGRFSGSKPNLQQVSAKDEESFTPEDAGLDVLKGQIVRRLFIPEEEHDWIKADYSQVEYRILAHYATGRGADELRASYREDKNMDYHQRIMDLAGLERRPAKTLNFGSMYGMGVPKTAAMLGVSVEEADLFSTSYHNAAPYVRATRNAVQNAAARRGYIFTLLNRRARTHASRKLHSLFNRLIQGSAADVMKKAMVDCERAGIYDVLPLHMTVHDETDNSKPRTKEGDEAMKEMIYIMENTVQLDVPLLVDAHVGANWAEAD